MALNTVHLQVLMECGTHLTLTELPEKENCTCVVKTKRPVPGTACSLFRFLQSLKGGATCSRASFRAKTLDSLDCSDLVSNF